MIVNVFSAPLTVALRNIPETWISDKTLKRLKIQI